MKLSENNSYILAVIIVILGTLAIAAGFTVGLLSLTEFDDHVIIEDESPFDEIKPQSMDSPLSDDYIISTDYAIEELLIYSDDTENPSRDVKIREAFDSADKFVKEGRWIFIDKGNFTLTLYDRERIIREWEIAIGIVPGDKQRKGDNRTPNGVFKIRQIQDSSKWTHDFGDGNGEIEGAYGPWFIRLYTPPWTGIGIHGTHDSDSINSRASEGCIRMNNYDVAELKALVKIGMPVVIVE